MEEIKIRENKKEQKARNIALMIIGVMAIIWTVLGVLSFTDREDYERPMTTEISFADQTALKGKQVFQAYNCMDCHTIVGNGAYFAPDLTTTFNDNGAAWLIAYLGSPAMYPTEPIVNIQLQELIKSGDIDVKDLAAYYAKYPAAEARVKERGGIEALMPNLQFTKDEINALIAYFKYTGKINTAGWPPEVRAKETIIEAKKRELEEKSGIYRYGAPGATHINGDSDEISTLPNGESVARNMGCIACHSTDGSKQIGPSWKNIYGIDATLSDGSSVVRDTDYLIRSILEPDAQIVEGYTPRIMPSYEGMITEEDMNSIIDLIKSLK
ncbi:MAG TPA: c-type cytochrome [Arenibacter sp.]|nr:c-type cytochrome [Arenibacter sp.]